MRAAATLIGVARKRVRGGVLRYASGTLNPHSVLATSVPATAALAVVFLAQQLYLRRSPFGEPGEWSDAWVALVHCFGAAYLPAAYLATLISGRRSITDLRSQAREATSVQVAGLPPFGPASWPWVTAGMAGAALTLPGPWLTEPGVGGPLSFWVPARWAPEVFWHRVLGLWIGLWVGWFGMALVQVSHGLSRLARVATQFDLFDAASLRPFVRHGLSNGLTAAGLATLIGLLGFDMGFTMMLVVFGSLSVTFVIVAVALPLFGVQSRIRRARQEELAWCDWAIAEMRADLRSHWPDDRRVENVATWPLDTPTLRRVLLYLIIPLLTWVVSALIQAMTLEAIWGT